MYQHDVRELSIDVNQCNERVFFSFVLRVFVSSVGPIVAEVYVESMAVKRTARVYATDAAIEMEHFVDVTGLKDVTFVARYSTEIDNDEVSGVRVLSLVRYESFSTFYRIPLLVVIASFSSFNTVPLHSLKHNSQLLNRSQ